MQKVFYGKGMKFPPQINPATGRFVTVEGTDAIKESIYLILMTNKTERFIRPEFGSKLMNYTFIDTGATVLNIMAREISNDILNNEPRVDDVSVEIDSESKRGCLIINIQYRVRENNTVDNLVFPFYLDTSWSTDEEESEG
jgi:phage baseplate assembly protein W